MKRITFIFLIGILFFTTGQAQNKKEIRFEKEFQKTLALVNSDQFTVKFYIATPTVQTLFTSPGAGANIDINPQNCYLSINDSLVTTQLPYFGRATWASNSHLDSVSFNTVLFSRTVKIYQDGKKKAIAYQITVRSNQDICYLNMDIQYDGTCYLYFSDRKRAPISYGHHQSSNNTRKIGNQSTRYRVTCIFNPHRTKIHGDNIKCRIRSPLKS